MGANASVRQPAFNGKIDRIPPDTKLTVPELQEEKRCLDLYRDELVRAYEDITRQRVDFLAARELDVNVHQADVSELKQTQKHLETQNEELQLRKNKLHQWIDPFKEDNGNLRIQSGIIRSRVWFIGVTGHGKTTTIGHLLRDPEKRGRGGFSHHTCQIEEHDFNVISPRRQVLNVILTDTRGPGDSGQDKNYTCDDLYIDINRHISQSDENRLVVVVDGSQRLTPPVIKLLRDVDSNFGDEFVLLLTKVPDEDAAERIAQLREKLAEKKLVLAPQILTVDWPRKIKTSYEADPAWTDELDKRRWKILEATLKTESIDVRSLSRQSTAISLLESVERFCFSMLRRRGMSDALLVVSPFVMSFVSKMLSKYLPSVQLLVVLAVLLFALRWLKTRCCGRGRQRKMRKEAKDPAQRPSVLLVDPPAPPDIPPELDGKQEVKED